jgi:hypothetical protein
MSRSDVPPSNKKAVKCEDCGKWVTLQGYGGHRRFYHGEYQKNLKQQLLNQLVNLRAMDRISKPQFESMSQVLAANSIALMKEIQYIKNFIDSVL